jgi:hypothetical protein
MKTKQIQINTQTFDLLSIYDRTRRSLHPSQRCPQQPGTSMKHAHQAHNPPTGSQRQRQHQRYGELHIYLDICRKAECWRRPRGTWGVRRPLESLSRTLRLMRTIVQRRIRVLQVQTSAMLSLGLQKSPS